MLTSALMLMMVAAPIPADAPRAVEVSPYRYWSVNQLRAEYLRLEDLRPGYALPMISLMAGLTGIAVSLFAYGIALGNFRGADTLANIAFGLGGTVSLSLTAFGSFQLARTSGDRQFYGREMERVERLADGSERDERLLDIWEQRHGPGSLPPPLIGPPPKGPPPPPSAPPIVPGPPIFPGRVSLMIPLLSLRF